MRVARDANNQATALAVGRVNDTESSTSWKAFDTFAVAAMPGLNTNTTADARDADKGGKASHDAVLPNSKFHYCGVHAAGTVAKNTKAPRSTVAYTAWANAPTRSAQRRAFEQMSKPVRDFVEKRINAVGMEQLTLLDGPK